MNTGDEEQNDVRDLREYIDFAAYSLFAERGIRDVSLEEIEHDAGVSADERAQVYLTKDDVAAAFLKRRERIWTFGLFESGARAGGKTPEGRLLAMFDVLGDWFHRDDYEACSFINTLLEMGAADPLGQASIEYLEHIRQIITALATEAELHEPAEFAMSFHILMKGAIVSASEGDAEAAPRSKAMARALIAEYRQIETPVELPL